MTYEEIISLGWKDRWPSKKANKDRHPTFVFEAPGYDYHIMSVTFDYEDGFDHISINCVPKETEFNEWENSECHFYGQLKTSEELHRVMMYLGIIEYKDQITLGV